MSIQPSFPQMPTYSESNFEGIAGAIRVDVAVLKHQAEPFEAAARWYRLDRGSFEEGRRPPAPEFPFARRKKMKKLAASARSLLNNIAAKPIRQERIEASWRRLLDALGVADLDAAEDGPGDPDILVVLTFPAGISEEHVLGLVRQIGRHGNEAAGMAAVAELEWLANEAAEEAVKLGNLTVPKGHHGDRAINDWIAAMMELYRAITGREPGTAVDPISGLAGGHLIQFLAAAAKPVGIKDRNGFDFAEDAWRSRVRTILAGAP